MSAPADDEPFLLNVAGLLGDTVGADRDYDIADATRRPAGRTRLAEPDRRPGAADARRTAASSPTADLTHGARGGVRPLPPAARPFPLDLAIEEEYLPSIDLATGRPVPADDEPDALRLTDHHELDLAPVGRATRSRSPSRSPRSTARTAPACARPAACRSTRARTTTRPTTSTRGSRRCAAFRRRRRGLTSRAGFAVDSALGAARRHPLPRA